MLIMRLLPSKNVDVSSLKGSMFVVKRSSDPRFNIVVMNRTSKDNFVFPMSAKFQKQVREPYFIFANRDDTDQQIRGAWFHDDGEREAIGKTLDRIVNAMSSNPEPETNADEKVKKRISNSQATATLLSALKIEKNHEQDDKKDSSNNTRAPNTQEEMKMLQNIELNKKELQLSLLSLINDERFIDLIHAQYLKIVRSRGQVDSDN